VNTYKVEITETLKRTVEIEAENSDEAEEIAQCNWRNSEYILDADNFSGVDFKTVTREKERNFER